MKLNNNTILITGGASGIGLALAERLLQLNNTVIVCGRNANKLKKAKERNAHLNVITCDISSEPAVKKMVGEIEERYPQLNFLINNAGIINLWNIRGGSVSISAQKNEILTNFFGAIHVAQSLLPVLLRKKEAAILNVTSALAYVPLSAAPIYNATKAALHSYSVSARHQLQGTPVKLFEVLPPAIDTDMSRQIDELTGMDNAGKKMDTGALVDAIQKGLKNDVYEMRPGMANALYHMSRVFPGMAQGMLNKQSKRIITRINGMENETRN